MPNTNVQTLNNGMEAAPGRIFERKRSVRPEPIVEVPTVRLDPYISCEVIRSINEAAGDEYHDLEDYQRALGIANDGYIEHSNGFKEPRYDFDDHHATMVPPEDLHTNHIYAGDVASIILRHFADDKGRINKPKEVLKRITRFTKRYNADSRRYNEQTQDALAYHNGFIPRSPRRSLGDDELENTNLRMLNGFFGVDDELEPFGRGNAYGLVFDRESRRFLQAERARSLDMLVGMLGIKHLDNELENVISSREHHITLIRLGLKNPSWELDLTDIEQKAPMPDTIVTQLDPKARAIIPNGK